VQELLERLEGQIQYATNKLEECKEGSPMRSYYVGMLEAYNDCYRELSASLQAGPMIL
jgi:hypothetical protein